MSLTHAQGKHIHFPATPDKFEFDAEVATIFDSMALRSIPMYAEVHRMHVEMFADKFDAGFKKLKASGAYDKIVAPLKK